MDVPRKKRTSCTGKSVIRITMINDYPLYSAFPKKGHERKSSDH